jgi:type I restriction enzyme S subunit
VLNSITPEYFGFSLFTLFDDSTIKFATTNSTGTTIPYIKWKNGLDSLKVALPSSKLASKFNQLIEPILEKFTLANQELSALSELRDTLLPKMISGELQISDAEKFLEEAGI